MTGVLGRLPPWPRNALNPSVIAAEQAYRKRSGLPLLSDQDVECLKAGQPYAVGRRQRSIRGHGGTSSGGAATAPAATATAVAVAAGRRAQRARRRADEERTQVELFVHRRRTELPQKEEHAAALRRGYRLPARRGSAGGSRAPAPRQQLLQPLPPQPRPASPAIPKTPPLRREGAAVRYVGTPAVGTSQAAARGRVATLGPSKTEVDQRRRRIAWTAVAAFLVTWLIAFFRFFLPRTLFEPSTVFKIGYPSDYGLGVDTKWQQKHRIWVDRTPGRLFVIYAVCTHLGCTPDWKPAKTNSNVHATAADTTAKGSTSRDPRRGPWTGRIWNWLLTGRSSWIPAICTPGRRGSRVILTTQGHTFRHKGSAAEACK